MPNITPARAKQLAALRKVLRARLETEHRWTIYLQKKKEFKKAYKYPEHICWVGAAIQMPPLNGSPPEYTNQDYQDLLMSYDGDRPKSEVILGPGGKLLTPEEIINAKTEARRDQVSKGGGNEHERRRIAWDKLRREVAKLEQRKTHKRRTPSEVTLWVFENSGTPPEELNPRDVPSRGALRLLEECNDKGFYPDLAKVVINKYANKDEDVGEQAIFDDNRKHLLLMEKMENFDPELLDDVELAAAMEQDELDREAGLVVNPEDEFGSDDPAPEPAADEEPEDPLDALGEDGAEIDGVGGDE